MRGLVVDIFEDGVRVVRHVFYGKTMKDAEAISRAHSKTDSFYRAAITSGKFKGMNLAIAYYWTRE